MGLLDQKKLADQLFKKYDESSEKKYQPREKPVISRLADKVPTAKKVEVSLEDKLTGDTLTELEEAGLSDNEMKILSKIEKLLHEEQATERFGIAILSQQVANRAWIKIDDKPAIPAKIIARETSNFSPKNQITEDLKRGLKEALVTGKTQEVLAELQKLTEDLPSLNDEVTLVVSNLQILDQHELSNVELISQLKAINAEVMGIIAKL
jgi:tRNA nucleotidyltransferase/poly(A) polymerase